MPWYEYQGGLPVGEPRDRVQIGISTSALLFSCPGVLGLGRWHYDLDRGEIIGARLDEKRKCLEIVRRGANDPIVMKGKIDDLTPLYRFAASLSPDAVDVDPPSPEFVASLAVTSPTAQPARAKRERDTPPRTLPWRIFLRYVFAVLGVFVVFAVSMIAVRQMNGPAVEDRAETPELAVVTRGSIGGAASEAPTQPTGAVAEVSSEIAKLPLQDGRLNSSDYSRLIKARVSQLEPLAVSEGNLLVEAKVEDENWRNALARNGESLRLEVSAAFLLRPPVCLADVHRPLISALVEYSQATVNVEKMLAGSEQPQSTPELRVAMNNAVSLGARAVQESTNAIGALGSVQC